MSGPGPARVVDLAAVKRAGAELDRLALAHPELVDRGASAAALSSGWLATLRDEERRMKQAFTYDEAAELCGLSIATLRKAAARGELAVFRTGSKGGRGARISRAALSQWWAAQGGGPLFLADVDATGPTAASGAEDGPDDDGPAAGA
jgi:excisionase family DNA binding protein